MCLCILIDCISKGTVTSGGRNFLYALSNRIWLVFFFFFSVWICKCFVVPSRRVVKRLFNNKNSSTKYKQRRCHGKHLNNLAIFKDLSFNRLIQKLDHFPFTNSQQSLIRSLFIYSSCDLKNLMKMISLLSRWFATPRHHIYLYHTEWC